MRLRTVIVYYLPIWEVHLCPLSSRPLTAIEPRRLVVHHYPMVPPLCCLLALSIILLAEAELLGGDRAASLVGGKKPDIMPNKQALCKPQRMPCC
jgi:hypothetical protein